MTRFGKTQILDAYSQKAISKEDLKFLLKVGTAIPPIAWIRSNEKEQNEDDRKRELFKKVFGIKIQKVEWIK